MTRVEGILRSGKTQLVAILNGIERGIFRYHHNPSYAKMFKHSPNIFEVMDELSIDVPKDKPCIDPDGKEMDGAAPGSKPTAVCISAFNASQKLSEYEARAQLLALLAHEASHLAGLNEVQASELQLYFLNVLNDVSYTQFADPLFQASLNLSFYGFDYKIWLENFSRQNFESIQKITSGLEASLSRVMAIKQLFEGGYPLLNNEQDGFVHELYLRQFNWVYFICMNTKQTPERLKDCRVRQDEIFQNAAADRSLSLAEFHQRIWFLDRPYLMDRRARVFEIESIAGLEREVRVAYEVLKKIELAVHNLDQAFVLN